MHNTASFICYLVDFLDHVNTNMQTSPKMVYSLSGDTHFPAVFWLYLIITL